MAEVARLVVGDGFVDWLQVVCPQPLFGKELADILDLAFECLEFCVITRSFEKFLIFLQGGTASGTVGDDRVNIQCHKEVQIVLCQAAGCLTIPFCEMGSTAALLLFRGDHLKALMSQDFHCLSGHFRIHQCHNTAEEEGYTATLLPFGWHYVRQLRPQWRMQLRHHPFRLVDPLRAELEEIGVAYQPLDAELLVEACRQHRGFEQVW